MVAAGKDLQLGMKEHFVYRTRHHIAHAPILLIFLFSMIDIYLLCVCCNLFCPLCIAKVEKIGERENIERKQRENKRYFLYNIRTDFHCVYVQLYIITLSNNNRLTVIPDNVGLVLHKDHVSFIHTREVPVK